MTVVGLLGGVAPARHIPFMSNAQVRRCPICGKPAEQRFRPFCSRRCIDVDLNRWLSGVYSVPVAADEEEGEPAVAPDQARD